MHKGGTAVIVGVKRFNTVMEIVFVSGQLIAVGVTTVVYTRVEVEPGVVVGEITTENCVEDPEINVEGNQE